VNAAMQLMGRGIYPFGAILGGLLAGHFGVRTTLGIGACGALCANIWLIASPLRHLRSDDPHAL